jgi:hypothetical protein
VFSSQMANTEPHEIWKLKRTWIFDILAVRHTDRKSRCVVIMEYHRLK